MKPISAQHFIETLEFPTKALSNALGGGSLRFIRGVDGAIQLQRRSTVLEAQATIEGGVLLISIPLHEEAMMRCHHIAHFIRNAQSPFLSSYTLLKDGARLGDSGSYCDLILERIPEAPTLEQYLEGGCRSRQLLEMLRELHKEFQRIGFSHNNLKEENLLITPAKQLLAIRPHLASLNGETAGEREAFRLLRQKIHQADATPWIQAVEQRKRIEMPSPTGARWPASEGLFCVKEGRKYGYKECSGEWAIAPRYYRAENFREGRAEVQSSTGAGLIDKSGNYIISPHYEMIDYNELTGITRARKKGVWYRFDYMGKPLEEEQK